MAVLRGAVGRADAEDCFQETFLAALRAYPKLNDSGNLRGWLLTIAHRKAIDHHRANGRRPSRWPRPPETAVRRPGARARHLGGGRGAAAEAARRGGAALRLRPPPRRDRRRARLLARGGAAQPARRNEATEKGAGMKAELQAPRRARRRGGAARRRLRDHRFPLRPAAAGPDPARPGPRRPAEPGPGRGCWRSWRADLPARAGGPRRARRGATRARPLLRGQADRVRPAARLAAQPGLSRARCCAQIARIPYGQTRSYMQIAASAGNERAVRAAGTACGVQPDPDRRPLPPRPAHAAAASAATGAACR